MRMLWELPQNLVGYIVLKVSKSKYRISYKESNVYSWKLRSGVSLGKYIFVNPNDSLTTVRHEYGHTIQSKYLGWLYIPIILLPSMIWAGCFESYRKKRKVSYYSFYTEKWADKLGGVKRGVE